MSGIGTRRNGFYVHESGIDITHLVSEELPLQYFQQQATRIEDAVAFIDAAKAAGATILIELTTLNPSDGQPALTHIRHALQVGMDVITANKGPVAFAQAELQALARHHNVQFRFESTVMDGLPLINLHEFTLQGVGMRSFRALINTTSSLVLSMIEQGHTLEDAIVHAQKLGIAEADPWHDLDGWDAVMKTTILANNLLDGQLTPQMVSREGIRKLSLDDIRAAGQSGTPMRLVSHAYRHGDQLSAEVRPCKIEKEDILQVSQGTTSIISIETEAMGPITLIEHESHVTQTAYGLLSDLITILKH